MELENKKYSNCKLTKERIDILLSEMARIFTNLGTDSTLQEIQAAYKEENRLIDLVAELDPEKAASIRPYANS